MTYRCITKCFTGNRLFSEGEIVVELPNEDCADYFVKDEPYRDEKIVSADSKHIAEQKEAKKKAAGKKKDKKKPAGEDKAPLVAQAKALGLHAANDSWGVDTLKKNIAKREKQLAAQAEND